MGLFSDVQAFVWRLCARRYSTMFGTAKVYLVPWEDSRIRVLDVNDTYQSATYLDERWCEVPFPYLKLYDCIFSTSAPARNVCMLGGGGYAFPKHVVAHYPHARIDVVEVDPTITRIAKEHFFLNRLMSTYETNKNGRLGLVCDDALSYLRTAAKQGIAYDAILNDCFAASNPDASLASPEAIQTIDRCLSKGGLYLTNVISALVGSEAQPLAELTESLSCVFSHVYALPCDRSEPDERDNVVVVASQQPATIQNALPLRDTPLETCP